ncbi:Uncharacterised protein [uncultured archaeon]|nr:Uncharacterised protein [uncultured archaeon]
MVLDSATKIRLGDTKMVRKSSVGHFSYRPPYEYGLVMDSSIDELRRIVWVAVNDFKKTKHINICDISMALGIVQYELMQHSDENEWCDN